MLCLVTLHADDILNAKIESLITSEVYEKNKNFIDIIFTPTSQYYEQDHLDVVKIVETLTENGLLNLFYKKPQEITLSFSSSGTPLHFVKVMSDTLRSMGYYRYITKESTLDKTGFTWSISFKSEYATDPILLKEQLNKRGCDIIDLERRDTYSWHYQIDMNGAHLNVKQLTHGKTVHFKRSLYAHWLDVSKTKQIVVTSLKSNNWYPYIAYYDASLRLLKVYKRDKKTWQITLNIPRDTMYVKVSDLYTLKNIKDGLKITAKGKR